MDLYGGVHYLYLHRCYTFSDFHEMAVRLRLLLHLRKYMPLTIRLVMPRRWIEDPLKNFSVVFFVVAGALGLRDFHHNIHLFGIDSQVEGTE